MSVVCYKINLNFGMEQQQGFQFKAFCSMSILPPIQSLLETYDQPFFRKPALASQNLLIQQQLADWVHQIYFDQKKLNELSVLRLIEHPLEAVKPNIKCSIMYSIIRLKVQQVCKSIRQLILDSYRKLHTKKQTNSDLKHSSDSWNVNFSKFRKANLQTSMNKVYGPVAHIVCTYHNSLLDCNKEVYDLWKLLYQCSDMKDLEFKTLQGNLNELILQELMQQYPNNEMIPKDVMPTLSSFQKHEFIFKEMWGFQKRKLAVQFHAKNQQSSQPQKQRQNSLMNDQNMPKRVQKGQVLSPPKPIPLSLKQIGVNTTKTDTKVEIKKLAEKQLAKKKAMQQEIQFMQLQQQFSGLDSQTRIKILQHLYDFKRQPSSNKQKQQTLKTIQKIILENLTENEKQTIMDQQLTDPVEQPLQIQLQEDDGTESDDGDNNYFYEEDNQIDQDNQNDDLMIRMKLKKMKEIEAFENFSQQWRSKRLQDTKDQEIRARQTGQRYLKLCERLDKIRKTYKAAGIEFKDPQIEKALNQTTLQAKMISDEIQEIQQSLPQLIPINFRKAQSIENEKITEHSPLKLEQKLNKLRSQTKVSQPQKEAEKSKIRQKPLKIQSSAYSLKLDEQTEAMKKQSLYQKLKKYYETKTYEQFYHDNDDSRDQKRTRNSNTSNTKSTQSEMFFGRNLPMSAALADLISDKSKSISHSFQSFTSNSKLSSKLQKISRQEILDQIYEVAKQKEKRQKKGHNIRKDVKLTYKKISYQVRSGDERNQIKITKGELTTDDFNWFDDLPDKAKYHLGQANEFAQKLIDEPNEDICQEQKPEKKKKKKKKKKNKQKKELSQQNENNFDKASNSSLNEEQEDLQPLQEFKKRSISDLFNLRKMMGWPEGQSLQQYLESSELLEREKEQQLLMEKKIEIYEKNGQKEKSGQRDRKTVSKENKQRRQNYNEQELKLFQFLENLEIKDDNRDKCVVSEETLQRIVMKRKQIKSMQIFEKVKTRTESVNHSNANEDNERASVPHKSDLSTPKVPKPKNKKKKK